MTGPNEPAPPDEPAPRDEPASPVEPAPPIAPSPPIEAAPTAAPAPPVEPAPQAVPPYPPTYPPTYWVRPEAQPAGPAPGYVYVGFWRRTVAFLIDAILLTLVSYSIIIPMVLGGLTSADLAAFNDPNAYTIDPVTGRVVASEAMLAAMGKMMAEMLRGFVVVFLLQGAYFILMWAWRGASLGQIVLGVEIREESDGRRIGFWRSCLRYVGLLISAWVVLLGFIWVAIDARKQGWHDKIAGTFVVRKVT